MRFYKLLCIFTALLVCGCALLPEGREAAATRVAAEVYGTQTAQAPTATPTLTDTPVPTPTATATVTATPTPSPVPTPTPLSPEAIFQLVSPAVAFIQTSSDSTGSGVLIEGGYVLTNAHVVWPRLKVRVVFGDGTEIKEAPVLAQDMKADLALIGPLKVNITPQALVGREDLPVGSPLMVIGYPGESEAFPKATMAKGVLSRVREFEILSLTYLQTDAAIAGGQSGGVLVSEKGEVIGITGFRFARAFGLAASSEDLIPRVKALKEGSAPLAAPRALPTTVGKKSHTLTLDSAHMQRAFVLREPVGTTVRVTLKGRGNGVLVASLQNGEPMLMANRTRSGTESGSFKTESDLPYVVLVMQAGGQKQTYTLTSSHNLIPLDDPDDEVEVGYTNSYWGQLDHAYDLDIIALPVAEGDVVAAHASSVMVDCALEASFLGPKTVDEVTDDNSGGGLFGTDAALTLTAPADGYVLLMVHDSFMPNVGAYRLTYGSVAGSTLGSLAPKASPTP